MTIEGVHAHVYPPLGVQGPAPYVIFVHGGPTGSSPVMLDLEIAYFTSRGLGVAEVNYGGSAGYGRAYRERLRHQWGVVDVQDCAKVARGLVELGRADAARIAIRGGSAGMAGRRWRRWCTATCSRAASRSTRSPTRRAGRPRRTTSSLAIWTG
ncbi:prolyl oligopeptidase family serine peptidase [Nonomuraea ferruginea]